MPKQSKPKDGAQNQHYVPKLILRNFMSDPEREQVTVFDKATGRIFTPNIAGIMAERRFHDFQISNQYVASFESTAGRFEDLVLPTYRRVLEERQLERSPEQQTALAALVAFQFLRTRAQRDRFVEWEDQVATKVKSMGGKMEDIEGYVPLTEDRLKAQHADFMIDTIVEFTQLIAGKDMMLFSAPPGRSFYLSDNPVVLHNSEPAHDFFGNIGLGVKGIEIYLPLSNDLLLACLCPSILTGAVEKHRADLNEVRAALFPLVARGQMTGAEMKAHIQSLETLAIPIMHWWDQFRAGTVGESTEENMDFYNSLQMSQARQFVVCKKGDFALAERWRKDFPNGGRSPRLRSD